MLLISLKMCLIFILLFLLQAIVNNISASSQYLDGITNSGNLSTVTKSLFEQQDPEILIGFKSESIWPEYCGEGKFYFPNFKGQGRRISETKCLEYIWNAKIEEGKLKRLDECSDIKDIIIGGRDADIGEFPHMGAIGWISAENNNSLVFKCGATLISEKFMLTAAHCSQVSRNDITVQDPKPKIVRLGGQRVISHLLDEGYDISGQVDVPIKRFIVHEQYHSPKHYYDIALIELNTTVTFDEYVRPACLWSIFNTSPINNASIAGWGVVNVSTRQTASQLQVAVVDLINSSNCNTLLRSKRNRNWDGLTDHQICAGHLEGGIDSCQGDSGGPLQVKIPLNQTGAMYYLLGVTSFGYGCARSNHPGIYTRVASFIDWIEKTTWENEL